MGRKSKRKGAVGELELAKELSRVTGIRHRRGRQYHGGPGTPDIMVDDDEEPYGVHWECKRAETFSVYKALEQSADEAGPEEVPVVVHRRNGKRWVVCVDLDDLPALAVRLYLAMARVA